MTLSSSSSMFYCPKCGIVWASDEAPICRHNVPDPDIPPVRMVPLPAWHPYAKEIA